LTAQIERYMSSSGYTIYASVWHIPPPNGKIKASEIAVFDAKGRFVHGFIGGNLDWYETGRFSKKMARQAVASYINMAWEVDLLSEKDVKLVQDEEVQERVKNAPAGGLQYYVAGEHVPEEKAFYLKAIYSKHRAESDEVALPERESPDIVKTTGDTDELGLKLSIAQYFKDAYEWFAEPDEIHLVSDDELQHLRQGV
jgi:hypothetical protein